MDTLATHCELSVVGFSIFGVYAADKAPVRDIFAPVVGNVCFVDESDGVCALDVTSYTLGKATKFIGRGDGPLSMIDPVL